MPVTQELPQKLFLRLGHMSLFDIISVDVFQMVCCYLKLKLNLFSSRAIHIGSLHCNDLYQNCIPHCLYFA